MAYRQLEQYLGRGEEKVLWLLSYKHAGGGLLGGFLGRFVFNALTGGSVGWAAAGMVGGHSWACCCSRNTTAYSWRTACFCSPAFTPVVVGARAACMPRSFMRRCLPPRTSCVCASATAKR